MTLHNSCTYAYQNLYKVMTRATYLHRNIVLCMRVAIVREWSALLFISYRHVQTIVVAVGLSF